MRTEPSPLRVAIVGCGLVVEQCHLPALRKIAALELVALADHDVTRLTRIADGAGIRRRHCDYRALLADDPSIDLVAVCAPPQFHAEIGLAVLDAGKHLFLEKPLALCLQDANRLVKRTASARGQALIGFNFRWHRLVRQARSIIEGGGLGPLATMHTTFASASAFRQQDAAWRQRQDVGGVLVDLGIHHFDLWRLVTGSEVTDVLAQQRTDGPGHERATVSAVMANGVLVTSSFSHGMRDANELEICGAKASLRLSCYRFDSLLVSENVAPRGAVRHWPRDAARILRNVPQAIARLLDGGDIIDSYRGQWQAFVDAVRNNIPIKPGLADGRSALQIAFAAAQSARTGRRSEWMKQADATASLTAITPSISTVG